MPRQPVTHVLGPNSAVAPTSVAGRMDTKGISSPRHAAHDPGTERAISAKHAPATIAAAKLPAPPSRTARSTRSPFRTAYPATANPAHAAKRTNSPSTHPARTNSADRYDQVQSINRPQTHPRQAGFPSVLRKVLMIVTPFLESHSQPAEGSTTNRIKRVVQSRKRNSKISHFAGE